MNTKSHRFLIFISIGLWQQLACSSSSSTNVISGDCEEIIDLSSRDMCFHDQIVALPSTAIEEVIASAKQMVDPMVRGAAVAQWIKQNNNEINQQKGQELCSLLDGRDRSYCMRRLSSPHLRR